MNWKNRLTNYNFWISIFSAVLLILQALKIEFDIAYVNEIFTAVLGLLVVIGIINDPTRTTVKSNTEPAKKETKKENEAVKQTENKEQQVINLPTVEENETDDGVIQNDNQTVLEEKTDLKTIIDKISTDLDNKIKQLEEYNKEMAVKNEQIQAELENKVEKLKIDLTEVNIEPVVNNQVNEVKEQISTPAVAETDCSYLNIIN